MRVLMLAPQPFLRARGTPLSVYHRIRALANLGHRVDLVTYPFGDDVTIPGLRIHRVGRVPGLRDVEIGPSAAKLILDLPFYRLARRLLRSGRYDLLHTHEEAGIMGAHLSRRYGVPHIYDMHSSLPEQFANFGRFNWGPVVAAFRAAERYTLNRADGVIAICEDLRELIRARGYVGVVGVIENMLQFAGETGPNEDPGVRSRLGLNGARVVLYTGTLEPYQGIDLLVDAAPDVRRVLGDVHFVIVGGTTAQLHHFEQQARRLGMARWFRFVPTVKPWNVKYYHAIADVLVTCRTRGSNTPLKVYHYLHAGRPIVATAIRSHTQVLDDSTAELTLPTAPAIAAGIVRVLTDGPRRDALIEGARRLARERFNEGSEIERLGRFLTRVRASLAPDGMVPS
jgi:glycosyltransferase involved in cell wall biosynthesis